MHPILFSIGDTPIHTYGAAGALGFLVVAGIVLTRATWAGIARDRVADIVFWASIAGIAGSRALFLYQNPEQANSLGDIFNLRAGGLVFYGAMLACIPTASLLMLKYELPFFKTWDIFSTALPLGHAISRIGCLMAGCCYGVEANVPWAVTYRDKLSAAPLDVPLHPTQLYEALWLVLICVVCNVLHSRKRFDGQITFVYLLLYAIGRSVVEEFRGDAERGFFLPELIGETLSTSQAISIVIVVVAVSVFFALPRYLEAKQAKQAKRAA